MPAPGKKPAALSSALKNPIGAFVGLYLVAMLAGPTTLMLLSMSQIVYQQQFGRKSS
jgi:hypothetical protein